MTTWNPGVSYGGGGIPDRTAVCHTLSPSGGDDTGAIQSALDDCPPDHVVQLEAGTFEINGPGLALTTSHVTLRGAGSGTPGSGEGGTRLVKADRKTNRNAAVLYVDANASQFASSTDLASDAAKGTNTLTLAEDPGLEVGEYVLVDHVTNNDPDVVWGVQHDGPGGGSRRWFARQDRSLSQILEITAVDGTAVRSPPRSTGRSAPTSRRSCRATAMTRAATCSPSSNVQVSRSSTSTGGWAATTTGTSR